MFKLDFVQTVAFAGLVLFLGYGIRRLVPILGKVNLPAPVIGGLIASLLMASTQTAVNGSPLFVFDTALQSPLMIGFFTTIGFGASLGLLKEGGGLVLKFFLISIVFAVFQNILGAGAAVAMGLHPLMGVMAGSVTLTGGPATGLTFAPLFESAGLEDAASIAVACGMMGIVSGGLVGAPVATYLINKYKLKNPLNPPDEIETPVASHFVEEKLPDAVQTAPEGEDKESFVLLKSLVTILVCMWIGSWISEVLKAQAITLPPYIGGMLIAALVRNLDDALGWFGLSQKTLDDLGNVALSLFIAMALMTVKLWEIANLALPLLVILILQILLLVVACVFVIYRLMGKDYESAVMSGGFFGFMMGTTANAMANMEALVEKYGAAPKAFLVIPMVGAFFIDFFNALLITYCINLFK